MIHQFPSVVDMIPVTNLTASVTDSMLTAVDINWKLPKLGTNWYTFSVNCHSEVDEAKYCPSSAQGVFPYQDGNDASTKSYSELMLDDITSSACWNTNPGLSFLKPF